MKKDSSSSTSAYGKVADLKIELGGQTFKYETIYGSTQIIDFGFE